MYVVYSWPPKT